MHREGHLGLALAAYAPLGFIAVLTGFQQVAIMGAVVAAVLSMAPDLDMRLPLIKHRGYSHTVWFALIVAIVGGIGGLMVGLQSNLLSAVSLGVFGFFLGGISICSHILGDALTPMGVRPFAPRNRLKYTYNVTRASNPITNYVLLGLGAGVLIGFLALGSFLVSLFH